MSLQTQETLHPLAIEAITAIGQSVQNEQPPLDEPDSQTSLFIPDELVERAQQGDENALSEVFRLARPVAYKAARRWSVQSEVDDIVQSGLEKVFEQGFRERRYQPTNFAGWVYRVVSNKAIDDYRKRSRRQTVPIDNELDVDKGLPAPVTTPGADRLGIDSPEVRQILAQAGISEEFSIPFIMHHVDGYSDQEIADILELRLPTVRTRIHRAKIKASAYYESHTRPDIA